MLIMSNTADTVYLSFTRVFYHKNKKLYEFLHDQSFKSFYN